MNLNWSELLTVGPNTDVALYMAARHEHRPTIIEALERGANPEVGRIGAMTVKRHRLLVEFLTPGGDLFPNEEFHRPHVRSEMTAKTIDDTLRLGDHWFALKVLNGEFSGLAEVDDEVIARLFLRHCHSHDLAFRKICSGLFRTAAEWASRLPFTYSYNRLLLEAASLENWDEFKYLVEDLGNVRNSALVLAAEHQQKELVFYLVEHGCDVNIILPILANNGSLSSILLDERSLKFAGLDPAKALTCYLETKPNESELLSVVRNLLRRHQSHSVTLGILNNHNLLRPEVTELIPPRELLTFALTELSEGQLREILGRIASPEVVLLDCLKNDPTLDEFIQRKLPEDYDRIMKGATSTPEGQDQSPENETQQSIDSIVDDCTRMIAEVTLRGLQEQLRLIPNFTADEEIKKIQEKMDEYKVKLRENTQPPGDILIEVREFLREHLK